MSASRKPRIAFWFRYGPAEHAELFHAIPAIVEALASEAEVHYFGMRTDKAIPPRLQAHCTIHRLPFSVDRSNEQDKLWKTFLWLMALPWIGLRCRMMGVQAVYIDETIPLTAPLARLFFGRRVAITIADSFIDVYSETKPWLRGIGRFIKALDLAAWRRLPLLFTRARNTQDFLAQQGVPRDRIHPVYDPCDFSIYHPTDGAALRARYGIAPDATVLVHHGILHPNKGNDRIIQAIAEHRARVPHLVFLLIGDGPDLSRLRDLVADLKMQTHVIFTGWLKTLKEVNDALNAGDIGLVMRIGQPSDDFHVTGALVHSMACGLPVLAARLQGVAEVVRDGENGLLFNPRTMEDFPDQLTTLYDDATLRKRLGKNALKDAHRHFDLETVTQKTVEPLLALMRSP